MTASKKETENYNERKQRKNERSVNHSKKERRKVRQKERKENALTTKRMILKTAKIK